MNRASIIYRLYNDTESYIFLSEREACKFLGKRWGHVSSCYRNGCKACGYKIEKLGPATHLQSRTRLYSIWAAMKRRCCDPKHCGYKRYGGRGITICDDWLGEYGFVNFARWAKNNGYSDELSLDRINNDGNYEPSNCRFVTQVEQGANNSRVHLILVDGEYLSPRQIFDKYGIKRATINYRLRNGLDPLTGERINK